MKRGGTWAAKVDESVAEVEKTQAMPHTILGITLVYAPSSQAAPMATGKKREKTISQSQRKIIVDHYSSFLKCGG